MVERFNRNPRKYKVGRALQHRVVETKYIHASQSGQTANLVVEDIQFMFNALLEFL